MFNTKRKSYSIYKPVAAQGKTEWNEYITAFEECAKANIFISLNARTNYSGNDTRVTQCDYIGVTDYDGLKRNMRVGDCYLVTDVVFNGREYFVYLKELENNGRIDI